MLTESPTFSGPTPAIRGMTVRAFTIPTETPEADGTLDWDATTMVVVELNANGSQGLGFTYADDATARFIETHFRDIVMNANALDIPTLHQAMTRKLRNMGRAGVAAMALSAVDIALWDLKAHLLHMPLARLFGMVRNSIPFYGSGGFTTYSVPQLQRQLKGWADQGFAFVKMKIGTDPRHDLERVRAAKEAIGHADLFVDANGAYTRKQALEFAEEFSRIGVRWFEEPVSSDDLDGLRLLRDRGPAGLAIAAGEYGYDLPYFRRMLDAGAVDVLQIDVTRCGGYTVFQQAAALAAAYQIPISAHCAPSLHVPIGLAHSHLQHIEYFFDHARIEQMLFDGAIQPHQGAGRPNLTAAGHGLRLREKEAAVYAVA